MSKIPKLPKGQSRPASPELSPIPLNANNTPNMQVLQPRSSSLTRSSSLRRSFIRPPKSSVTPPMKSGSPPPSTRKCTLAKGLPPSGLPTTGITPPRTGLPPKGIPSLPPSGLTPPVSVPKYDSPNTKMLSSSPILSESKLPSPRKSSFSRHSPLRSSRIPKKKSLPPDPYQERAESVTSEKADSISSEMADSISSGHSDDSRNSSPTPSNISKIPTVKGSTPSSVSARIETLKNRRLKYPALWGLGAPNFFSEEKEMAGNTSLELLRLGVEELETRVTSLECQMGIQNTELLYNSDDEDKSQQDTNTRMHDATEANVTPSAVSKSKTFLERENSNLSLSPLDIMYTYKPTFSLQDLQNVSKAYNWDMEDHLVICQERGHFMEDPLLRAQEEPYHENESQKVIQCQYGNHYTKDPPLGTQDEPCYEKESQQLICEKRNHFTEDPLLDSKDEQDGNHINKNTLFGTQDEPCDEKESKQVIWCLVGNHYTKDPRLVSGSENEPCDEKESKPQICQESNHLIEDTLLGSQVELCDTKERKFPYQEIILDNYEYSDDESAIEDDVHELTLDNLENLLLPDEKFNVSEEDILNACEWKMEDVEAIVNIQEEQYNETLDNDPNECIIPDANIPFETIDTFDPLPNSENRYKIDLGQTNDQCIDTRQCNLIPDVYENKLKEISFSIQKSNNKQVIEEVNEIEIIDTYETNRDNLVKKSTENENAKSVVSVRSAIIKPGEVIASTVAVTLLAIPDRIRNILLMLENKLGVRLIETFLKKSNPQYDFVRS